MPPYLLGIIALRFQEDVFYRFYWVQEIRDIIGGDEPRLPALNWYKQLQALKNARDIYAEGTLPKE